MNKMEKNNPRKIKMNLHSLCQKEKEQQKTPPSTPEEVKTVARKPNY